MLRLEQRAAYHRPDFMQDLAMTESTRLRACPLCEAICGLELRYVDDELTAIRGDANDPFSRGHICPKGNALIDLERDPDRLRRPLRRRGRDWEEVSWDDAIAEAAERLAAVQREHGEDALGVYLGNPNVHHLGSIAYLPPLLRALRTRNRFSASSVDQWPHQLVNLLMYGHQWLLPIPDIDHTDYCLMLGANPVASNGSLMTAPGIEKRLKALVSRGRLVVVDPRRSETAAIASEHLAIRPGGDVWFLLALLREMLAISPPRVVAYGERLAGLEEALQAIVSVDLGDLAARTGIAPEEVRRIAGEFLAAPTALAYGRMGVSTQRHGSLSQWLIQLTNLVSGNLDRVGGALPNQPIIPVSGPGTSPGSRGRWHSRVRGLPELCGELPVAALTEEIVTPGAGQIRALLTSAGNPVLSTPNGRALDVALVGLDFMVSIDPYLNETTRHAHLILPPASSLSQYHYDVYFNAFAVRRVARLSVPLAERGPDERGDWEILSALGAAYANETGKAWTPLPPPRELLGHWLKAGGSGIDIAALESAPHGLDLGPLEPSLLQRLQTADGRIQCAPPLMLEALEALRSETVEQGGLRLIGRRHVRSNNSWMHNAPRLVKGKPRHHLLVHPQDLVEAGIADGARARLASRSGVIEVDVMASEDVGQGTVCLPHGFGHQREGVRMERASQVEGASYNDLGDPLALDQPSSNAALNGLAVRLQPLG